MTTNDDEAKNKKHIDWEQKALSDSERITRRGQKRKQTKEAAQRACPPPDSAPLLRLRKKIREVYDNEDEEEEYTPFFNISLIEENEPSLEEHRSKQENETLRITKEQQTTGKLSLILSSSMAAKKAGLSGKADISDARLANSAEYNVKKMRKISLKNKIEKPLKLKGSLTEKELPKALSGLKKAVSELSPEALEKLPASEVSELNKASSKKSLAKLILKKSGRSSAPKKKVALIAKASANKEEDKESTSS